jgi:alpha-1,3-rhamnosyl/mannosyltransferase
MVRRSDRVIAVSEFIRDLLVERYGIPVANIDVVYNGVDSQFRPRLPGQVDAFRRTLGLPDRYVLCVGNVTPVKNHLTAVRAFAMAGLPEEVQLVVAGGTEHPYADAVVREAKRLGVADRVRLLGFVASNDLPLLMTGARVMLFPSLTEGCPVAMLEAFGCGLPIIASKRGGLWDLGQEIAHFVEDPLDHASFAGALSRLFPDQEAIESCRANGLAAAEAYTWERAAMGHLQCYEKLVAS